MTNKTKRAAAVAASTGAGAAGVGVSAWANPHHLAYTIMLASITALVGVLGTWLNNREETKRLHIVHRAETLRAEAEASLFAGMREGPSDSPEDAERKRADISKLLLRLKPTTLGDTMRATRSGDEPEEADDSA